MRNAKYPRRRSSRRSRKKELMLFALLVVGLIVAKQFMPEPETVKPSGRARVIDGDSIIVSGQEIRLKGIDAPELAQTCERDGASWPCGKEAARQLRFFLRGAQVTCEGNVFDKHDRLLAVCRIDEREVNRWMVEEGWAVSFDDYPFAERKARKESRGVWSGSFEPPHEWRERNPRD